MAMQTRANFAAYLSPLSVIDGIGEEYASQAEIMAAIGNFRTMAPGQLRVNWTAGVTAQVLDTGTAAGLTHTASPGNIGESFTVDFGVLVAPMSTDVVSDMVNGMAAADSAQMAVNGLYRGWVGGIVGSGDGTLDYLLGADTIVAKTYPAALGMHVSGSTTLTQTTYSAANMLQNLDLVTSKMPAAGQNVCICNNAGYNAVKAAVRGASYTPGSELGLANYGFNALYYDGTLFFKADSAVADITQGVGRGQTTSKVGRFYFYNNGPEGVNIVFPAGQQAFYKQGPKFLRTDASEVYDIFMKTQIIPRTPRSVAKLTCYIS